MTLSPSMSLVAAKRDWHVGLLDVVFDEMHDGVDAAMHGAAVLIVFAEILALWFFLIFCDVDGVVDELVDALVFRGGDWHDWHAELFLEGVDVDGAAVGVDFVHHVEGDDHGDAAAPGAAWSDRGCARCWWRRRC